MLSPRFRLRHVRPDIQRQQRRYTADPEHPPPTEGWKHNPRCHRRQQISDGVSALQDPRKQSAPSLWRMLHRERCSYAPFASHADAVQAAQNKKSLVIGSEAAGDLDYGKINDV